MSAIFSKKSYINFPMLFRTVGWLLMIISIFMIIPMVVSIIYQEHEWMAFLISMGITLVSAFGMMSLQPRSREMGKREAILLTSMTWVILSLFGMLPFLLCKTHLSITDAFFETMSGFTTTGASVLNSLENVPKGILIWRCVIQWIGGMGIILFTLAVLPMLNYQGGMQLFNAEVTGITHDKLRPRVSNTAKSLWIVYTLLTITLIVLLSFSEMPFFDAVCHGLSTMSTGGFSTNDMSISAWDTSYVKIVITVFMFIGGVSFALIYKLVTGQTRSIFKNEPFRWYCLLTGIAFVIFSVGVYFQGLALSWDDMVIDPLFQAVSVISSTGIMENDFSHWGAVSQVVIIFLMFTGACAGSTSGGMKIDRIIILVKFLKNEFYKMMHSNSVTTVCINGKGTSYIIVMKVLAFIFVYFFVVILGGVLLNVLGFPLRDGMFCALSAISNTGIGTETTGVAGNFAYVSDAAKWLLSFIMLVGRLELFTVLLLFTRAFWKK